MSLLVGAVGIELLVNLTKSRVFTVLPTANQMNWSQMELNFASSVNLKFPGRLFALALAWSGIANCS